MQICVFEDNAVRFLEPLTLTRPASSLRCGTSSLLERQKRSLAADQIGLWIRPDLRDVCRLENPGLSVNDNDFLARSDVLVNARWLPVPGMQIDKQSPHVGLVEGQVAYVVTPSTDRATSGEEVETLLNRYRTDLPAHEVGGSMIEYLWNLIQCNADVLAQDLRWFKEKTKASSKLTDLSLLGPEEQCVVSPEATIEPFVTVDTRSGPVLIDEGAVIQSFSRIEGPCYIGKETWIVGAKVRGGSIGPHCRIGGEVEASIVQGYSNKYHDGFLGHSYIGSWVNLAAGTQTSDLRNDYGQVRVSVAGQRISTGLSKVGSFIGDHTKTGLGALLNTGSVIGAFCNVLPAGSLLPQVVPSFCQVNHGQIRERQDMRQLFTTVATVMSRRGETFTDSHRDLFYTIYDQTADLRHRVIRESEMRMLRRSV